MWCFKPALCRKLNCDNCIQQTLLLLRDCTARQDKQSEPHAHATLQSVPLAQNIAASLVHLLQHRHARRLVTTRQCTPARTANSRRRDAASSTSSCCCCSSSRCCRCSSACARRCSSAAASSSAAAAAAAATRAISAARRCCCSCDSNVMIGDDTRRGEMSVNKKATVAHLFPPPQSLLLSLLHCHN